MARGNRPQTATETRSPDVDGPDLAAAVQRLARVMALSSVKDEIQGHQIEFLSKAGYAPSEIAEMLGTTPGNVSQTLYELKIGRRTRRAVKKK
jgi:CRP-like cAMP-binding protein